LSDKGLDPAKIRESQFEIVECSIHLNPHLPCTKSNYASWGKFTRTFTQKSLLHNVLQQFAFYLNFWGHRKKGRQQEQCGQQ